MCPCDNGETVGSNQIKSFLTITTQHLPILPFPLTVYSEYIDLDCYMFLLIKEPSSGIHTNSNILNYGIAFYIDICITSLQY
jgi:hypothetical protein